VFIEKDFVKPNSIEKREFQIKIANLSLKENTLVVIPTGLGKTVIALILIAEKLKNSTDKILFLAPTKPLVLQHASFLKENLTINDNSIAIFTGEISPSKRTKMWKEKRIIVSTPQVIQNDLLSKRFDLKHVSLIIFDEAHHAIGDYAYVFVSEMYKVQREERHIFAITASPGSDISKILDVCKNLEIQNIQIRTKYDPDVKPYVHDLKIEWKDISLPKDFSYIVQLLRKALSLRLKKLKEIDVIDSASITLINKRKLLDAQKKIQTEIQRSPKPHKVLFQAASIQSEAMKIHYALELIQTQGVNAFNNYFQRMSKEAYSKNSTKASRSILTDNDVIQAAACAKSLEVEHPKVEEIVKIVKKQLSERPSSKIIIFTHYRDTSKHITKTLEQIKNAKPVRFVGQALKENDKGLTQKQQAEIIKQFREDTYNILIATSVAEEGLDIPSTDLVIFYEPIPSEIRFIQRRGRTARKMPGRVIILITKGTPDEGYYWSAKRKEKRMMSELELLRTKIKKQLKDSESIYKRENLNQKTLTDYNKKNKEDLLKIIVDHREYRSTVVKKLSQKGVMIESQQLDTGDYILSSRIGVERKNVDDFLESLIKGKLFKQISQLREAYSRPVLILEGENLFTTRNINHNAIYGSLASITVDYGIPVLTTKNAMDTADLLKVIAKREQKDENKSVAVRGFKPQMSTKERQQFLVEGLPNVSSVIAKRLLNHFGSIRCIANADEKELTKVKGIGKNIAAEIIQVLNNEYLEK
jgi:ERCC4-related helicase